ncbi:MAG: HAD family hydrolase [Rhodobacterales bacterium]|nr:HAD family hydrolase [Rhodobacterales bacterium]
MRIAMWSGPRNLSTAMMYSFGARNDCTVVDEPFYAAYLDKTGLDHPMRSEILANQSRDPLQVVAQLTGAHTHPHFYQKHMTQHMVPGVPRDWMADMKNVFLIRHPARVVASFAAKFEAPTLADIGFSQQAELFEYVISIGQTPIVIDSADIRRAPERALRRLCSVLGLDWQEAMLSWPAGGRCEDGIWANHWYGAVHKSTGFATGEEAAVPQLSGSYAELADSALPYYRTLAKARIEI